MPFNIETIDPSKTAIIVVDMQNDFIAEGATLRSEMSAAMAPRLAGLLDRCRPRGVRVAYTIQAHRPDGSDLGPYRELYPQIAEGRCLIEGQTGIDIHDSVQARPGDILVTKRRYSAFFATDLDLILRSLKIDTVAVAGTTTENCCHATARDAMFLGYRVAFLSDLTGTYDHPDMGWGALPAQRVHEAMLTVLAVSTAHVMTGSEFEARLHNRN